MTIPVNTEDFSKTNSEERALNGMLTPELSKALAEVGFRAMCTPRRATSLLIFDTLRTLLPASECPVIGLALIAIGDGDPHAAVILLEGGLAKMPGSLEMKALLGRAFLRAGRLDQCARVLEQLSCCDAQSSVGRYVSSLRDELSYRSGPARPGLAAIDWTHRVKNA